MNKQFHMPTRPYTPIDALNRRAAATSSPKYAKASTSANYNGHSVQVWWNEFRSYYIAEYTWAGRNVMMRGSFDNCLKVALKYYNDGALGASISVVLRNGDNDAARECQANGLKEGPLPRENEWYTWRHKCAAESVKDYCFPNQKVLRFDWDLLQSSNSKNEYEQALKEKYKTIFD